MTEEWAGYMQLARELDDVRATERARGEGERVGAAQMSQHAQELHQRVEQQHEALVGLSQALRLTLPRTEPFALEAPVDPPTDLRRAAEAIDRADAQATSAAERGRRPSLLPGWPPFGRAAAVYGVAAAVILLGQVGAFLRDGDQTSALVVLFVIPISCFMAAYLTLKIGSQTRVKQAEPKTYTRLGLFTCLLVCPVGIMLLGLLTAAF